MKRILIAALALGLTACGDHNGAQQAASQRAADIAKVDIDSAKLTPGMNAKIKGYDAKGCKDKAKTLEVLAAAKLEDPSKMIKLIADGMKDQTCRGFADGLPVKIDHKDGDLTCILPGDDPENKQCIWISSDSL